MNKSNYLIPAVLIVLIELVIYFWTNSITTEKTEFYLLTSRYSARISFAMIIYFLFWTGSEGLPKIFGNPRLLRNFKILAMMLMLNHLIHFYLLSMNYWVNDLSLIRPKSAFGFIGYLAIILLPIFLWKKQELTRSVYRSIKTYLFIISGICLGKYIERVVDVSCGEVDFLILVFVIFLAVGMIWNVVRIIIDSRRSNT